MKYQYEILAEERVYDGFLKHHRYRLQHELYGGGSGSPITRERIELKRAASVLLYDPLRDEVVLIEQFRVGALQDPHNPWLLEIVGGHIEEGEDPAAVAHREAMEEAGCEILALAPICQFYVSPGTTNERIHLFCGRVDATKAGGVYGVEHEGEDIRVEVLKADAAIAELDGGRIQATTGIIALQWLALYRQSLRDRWLKTGRT